jgi:hypothetical protein
MRWLPGLMSVLFAAVGCTSYASARLAPDEAVRPAQVFGEIEKAEFAKDVQAKVPSDLVVAEVFAKPSSNRDVKTDKRSVQLVQALGKGSGTFSDVAPLFTDRVAGFEALRAAAASHHADLMLVAEMSERVADRTGVLAALNLLVVPCFVVPTQTNDLALHVRAAVVDVRNGLVYATFEDHREERVHATAVGEKDAVEEGFDRLYAASLEGLRTRVDERLRKLATAP